MLAPKQTGIFLPYLQSTSHPHRLGVKMKVLAQNRIDWFTEVQLSALAAFQAEQTDGRLSKNLGEEEGEKKKKEQSFSGNGLTSVVRDDAHIGPLQLNFLQCFWVSSCSLSKCNNKGKPHSTQSWSKLHLSVALPSVTQARHRESPSDTKASVWKNSFWCDLYHQGLDCFSKIHFFYLLMEHTSQIVSQIKICCPQTSISCSSLQTF